MKNTITFGATRMSLLRTSIDVPDTIITRMVTMTTAMMSTEMTTGDTIVGVDFIL
jgi:hypothetical protein